MTLFFVDTAHDPSEYVRAAWRKIADGGVWINMGPLLWHNHDMPGEVSIELTWQELRSLIVACVTPTHPAPPPPAGAALCLSARSGADAATMSSHQKKI